MVEDAFFRPPQCSPPRMNGQDMTRPTSEASWRRWSRAVREARLPAPPAPPAPGADHGGTGEVFDQKPWELYRFTQEKTMFYPTRF